MVVGGARRDGAGRHFSATRSAGERKSVAELGPRDNISRAVWSAIRAMSLPDAVLA